MSKTHIFAKATLVAAAAALLITPSMSLAKGGHQGPRASFETLDADGSGDVTLAEMQAAGATRFEEADANGDGFLSADEITQKDSDRAAKRVARMIEKRDANGDGQLSLEEMKPDEDRVAKRFARVDTDGNGAISQEEFDAMKKHRGGGRHKRASE
jgi:Ca2+-binding EF-hand superfamily protein